MNILVIGDTHIPAVHPMYLDFLKGVYGRFNIDTVVHIGDLVDFHYISRHPTEPDARNAVIELEQAKEELSKWTVAFPNICICSGNHDMIPYRQSKTLGIPAEYLKDLNTLLGLPNSWRFKDSWEIAGIIFEHGIGSNGMYGAKRTAEKYRMSYVQGHTHSYAGVWWLDGPKDSIFAMQVGCGVNTETYNMRYGKQIFKHNVALGCGVILDAGTSRVLPMFVPLNTK